MFDISKGIQGDNDSHESGKYGKEIRKLYEVVVKNSKAKGEKNNKKCKSLADLRKNQTAEENKYCTGIQNYCFNMPNPKIMSTAKRAC